MFLVHLWPHKYGGRLMPFLSSFFIYIGYLTILETLLKVSQFKHSKSILFISIFILLQIEITDESENWTMKSWRDNILFHFLLFSGCYIIFLPETFVSVVIFFCAILNQDFKGKSQICEIKSLNFDFFFHKILTF